MNQVRHEEEAHSTELPRNEKGTEHNCLSSGWELKQQSCAELPNGNSETRNSVKEHNFQTPMNKNMSIMRSKRLRRVSRDSRTEVSNSIILAENL